jgi:hypothetical protein
MPPAIQIEDGLSARELTLLITAGSTLVVSIAVAVAIYQISAGIMWALIILAVGSAGQMLFVGAGVYQRHRLTGQALVIEAEGRAEAAVTHARATERMAARGHAIVLPPGE